MADEESQKTVLVPGIYSYKDIPHFLQGNAFIGDGYRVNFSYRQCLHSLFYWTNETINIWTHLVGGLWFFWLLFHDNYFVLPSHGSDFQDHIVITLFVACSMVCLLLSSGYHVFCCHSERCYNRWFSLDLSGICLSLNSCYIPSLYYGFYCHKLIQTVYTCLIVIFLICNCLMQLNPRYLSKSWSRRRLTLFCCMALFGIVPAIHWIWIMMEYEPSIIADFLPKVFMVYGIVAVAFLFYTTKLPERLFPGYFDFIGSSHQWWHLFVIAAFLFWHCANIDFFVYRHKHECPAHT